MSRPKNKLFVIPVDFDGTVVNLRVTQVPCRLKPSPIGHHGDSGTRAYFIASKKPGNLGGITFEELDTEGFLHELGHAAFEAVRKGLLDCSCGIEEAVCRALGKIAAAAVSRII